MKKQSTLTADQLEMIRIIKNTIRDELRPLKEALQVNDLVNREEAIKILGISSRSFTIYINDGRVRVASMNAANAKFFSRKELLGLTTVINDRKSKPQKAAV
jgi:predicted DNA-binding protein (UPF0251 family)